MVAKFRVSTQVMFGILCNDFHGTYVVDWHYVEIFLTEYNPNRLLNLEGMVKILLLCDFH
jgi:hypothetical protein